MRDFDWARDELILACDLMRQNNWRAVRATDPRAKELSDLLRQLPLHPVEERKPNFRSINSVQRKTYDIETRFKPAPSHAQTRGGELDLRVRQEFADDEERMAAAADLIRSGVASGELIDASLALFDVDEGEDGAVEGALLARRHFIRERNRGLRARKIAAEYGDIVCRTCGLDFYTTYGERGEGYIECHHVVPLHVSGPRKTRLEDLVLLCANCHRMIHRAPWLAPDEMLDAISTRHDGILAETGGPGSGLIWQRVGPPEPESYDIAYKTVYNGGIFRAVRSRSPGGSWRLERGNPEDEGSGGISHERSLLACKQRLVKEIAAESWVVRSPRSSGTI